MNPGGGTINPGGGGGGMLRGALSIFSGGGPKPGILKPGGNIGGIGIPRFKPLARPGGG